MRKNAIFARMNSKLEEKMPSFAAEIVKKKTRIGGIETLDIRQKRHILRKNLGCNMATAICRNETCNKLFVVEIPGHEFCTPECFRVYKTARNTVLAGSKVTYFVIGAGMIKIGTTDNLETRLKALQCGSPVPLELLGVCQLEEKDLHERFKHLQKHGEWFLGTTELLEFIEGVKTQNLQSGFCEVCNLPFFSRRSDKRFCSDRCRKKKSQKNPYIPDKSGVECPYKIVQE